MPSPNRIFEIIRFTPDSKQFYPASMERSSWMGDNYVPHTDIEIPLGHSRYGGPLIDVPKGFKMPDPPLRFAAQLDMAKFAPHDKSGRLPNRGQLYFFADLMSDAGRVIYADVPNESLQRVIFEHEDNFFLGTLINEIYPETERVEDRLRLAEESWEKEDADADGMVWDEFGGSEKSKIFGIYTHCQMGREEIEAIADSGKVLLLQIGEGGFNDEGVFSVLIPEKDLIYRNFERCEFAWGQS